MNQSFFKEILEQEIHSVFLNPAEFGESVTLEGRTLDAVVDRPSHMLHTGYIPGDLVCLLHLHPFCRNDCIFDS